MKTTELFVEQTLTGFLVLTAAAAPFLSWEGLQELPDEAKGGVDISSAAGALGAAYLLGIIFDRFADTHDRDVHAVSPRLPEVRPGKMTHLRS
jgi:hypothetical protein